MLELQRSAGNAAVARMLARAPAAKGATGSVRIGGVGEIKVNGGNLEEWAGTGAPDAVEVASEKGGHSAKLEKLAAARTKTDVKVTISPPHKEGENLNVGGGFVLEIKDARIKRYAVEDGVETWQVAEFHEREANEDHAHDRSLVTDAMSPGRDGSTGEIDDRSIQPSPVRT